jgi:succinate dehydrogenase / fumarate reductase flavoprotein subunit
VGRGVYLDFADAIKRLGKPKIEERYGNLFEMYERITGEDAYTTPMRIYPAVHYTMGGLWVDYNLMSNIPGLFVLGEANFSDHGANRLGASALMQGLSDGYFVAPATVPNYLAQVGPHRPSTDHPAFAEARKEVEDRISQLMSIKGNRSARSFHAELGKLMWNDCGMARSAESLQRALSGIPGLRESFYKELRVTGNPRDLNVELERAGRVADYLEFAELLCFDALDRDESCGGHFRVEHQTPDGEAMRDDEKFCHVSAWEHQVLAPPVKHIEPLVFENVHLAVRSYK